MVEAGSRQIWQIWKIWKIWKSWKIWKIWRTAGHSDAGGDCACAFRSPAPMRDLEKRRGRSTCSAEILGPRLALPADDVARAA
jgi:hypothetical protein